ncbi:hypothetical protein ACFPRL_30195 [Pseudoclavibacter helvolus]
MKFATARPFDVYLSSGSAVRFPTTVMMVSPATSWPPLLESPRQRQAARPSTSRSLHR